MTSDPLCPICFQEVETVQHVIWYCRAVNDVWASSALPTQKWPQTTDDFQLLWDRIVTSLERQEIENVAFVLRLIWLRRNEFVFQSILKPPDRLIQAAILDHKEFQATHPKSMG